MTDHGPKNFGTQDYGIVTAELEDVTADHVDHLEALGACEHRPDYIYNDCRIWDGGMGVNLYQTPDGKWYCEA